jgi:epoxyqueuosine reductase
LLTLADGGCVPDPIPSADRSSLTRAVKDAAHHAGFDLVGIAPAVSPAGFSQLQDWLRAGFAGEMHYMPRREAAYSHPRHVSASVRSLIMLGMNYRTSDAPAAPPNSGRVARYAWGTTDYHDLLRERLRNLADDIHRLSPGCVTRGVVDTAPLLERDFARLAGLGWFGKNTVLINKRLGSWLLLAALLTDLDLEPDAAHGTSHCGTCTRCLDVCPTNAFTGPYVLDARKCISYLTIELKSTIPPDLRDGIGEWLFGCDLCQEVCPWNRKAPASHEPAFQPVSDLRPADCISILEMSREEFHQRFATSPLERPGFDGLRRNAAIVLGNHGDPSAVAALMAVLHDDAAVVRGSAAWALGKISGAQARHALLDRSRIEQDPDVREELQRALAQASDLTVIS